MKGALKSKRSLGPLSTSRPPNCRSMPYVIAPHSRVLILGSMPSVQSLKMQQYYGNPRNLFWSIMQRYFSFDPQCDYLTRVQRITEGGLALWDTLSSCERKGSLDGSIRQPRVNDFKALFQNHPTLTHVLLNGQLAAQTYQHKIRPQLAQRDQQIPYIALPSTSPAYARMKPAEKVSLWTHALRQSLEEKPQYP